MMMSLGKTIIFSFLIISLFISIQVKSQTPCGHPIISEYVEGSSNNKCIELYNPTTGTINLASYKISIYANGSAVATDIALSGSISPGATFVICNPSANSSMLAQANSTSGSINFNGDDAVVLRTTGNVNVDVFGDIGCDPGTAWVNGTLSTLDKTLTRINSICCGVSSDPTGTCNSSSFTTLNTSEWSVSTIDVHTLGSHNCVCGTCLPVSEPTQNSNAVIFTSNFCNEIALNWTQGNGSNRIVIASTSALINYPTDGTTYNANPIFGSSSSLIGGSSYVIYNGNGNSTNVFGLQPGNTYYFSIIEYNGTSTCINYSSITYDFSQTTPDCSGCASISSVIINSCNTSCGTEGSNEMIFFDASDSTVVVSTSNIQFFYGSNLPPTSLSDNLSDGGFVSLSSAQLDTMNSNCVSTSFIDGSAAGSIPPGSDFILVPSTFCANDFNFASLCGNNPIYVLASNDADWSSSGEFLNSSSSGTIRYFRTNINGCVFTYSYEPFLLGTQDDGDFITFPAYTGGSANNYGASGGNCDLPIILLEIQVLDFFAETRVEENYFYWKLNQNLNLFHSTIEESKNGINFNPIKTFSEVEALNQNFEFSISIPKTYSEQTYYRIKNTEKNGNLSYSNILNITSQQTSSLFYESGNFSQQFELKFNINEIKEMKIIDSFGKIQKQIKRNKNHLQLEEYYLPPGVYILSVSNGKICSNFKLLIY